MNTRFNNLSHGRQAFTLIELLTVIAIIGILSGILIPTVGAARNSANRAKTKAQFTQWATAMTSFKQEYGFYPIIAVGNKVNGNASTPGIEFANALTAKQNLKGDNYVAATTPTVTNYAGNAKLISFYTISTDDIDRTDPTKLKLVDAFGNTDIAVRVDTNGDGKIDASDVNGTSYITDWVDVTSKNTDKVLHVTNADTNLAANGVRAGVVFYSAGKGSADSDIVTTWQ